MINELVWFEEWWSVLLLDFIAWSSNILPIGSA